ncbi:MAG TPA: PspC domain-containing protein [Thermoanaerobaculia bacterium]|nr:PspC domain-containing protein [Thermoanaerobaculia bacterium]
MNCNDTMAALVASLENATSLTEEQREHIRACPRCSAMLNSAKEALRVIPSEAEGPPAIDAAVAAAEREVARKSFWRGVRVFAGALLLLAAIGALFFARLENIPLPTALLFGAAGFAIALLVATPILLLIWLVRGSGKRVYKRLGPGRLISGVCLGIAEATKIDVRLLRLIFVFLLFADGAGFWIYILLDLAMPVHPDDRQHLWRFRIRRWWTRSRHAEQRAG